jgi:hypothetical protein
MKEKLELHHLAPYLPYRLIMCEEVPRINDIHETIINHDRGELLSYLGTTEPYIVWECEYQHNGHTWFRETPVSDLGVKIKPILRPLSDYKDVNSQAMNDLNIDITDQILISDLAEGKELYQVFPYYIIEIMCRNHIDFQELIPKDLAIDVNTIKNQ